MLGATYLGSAFLGESYPEVMPAPPTPENEMGWFYVEPTETLEAAHMNQFLLLHSVEVVAQGEPVVAVSGVLATWQPLGEVDQPFVATGSAGWFRIPLSSTNLAPTDGPGWENAAPVTIQLCADDDGVPGTVLAATLLPPEQIEAVQGATWPEPADLLFGPAALDVQSSLPQLPGSGWAGISTLVAGEWGVLFATQGDANTQMWVVPYTGSDLGGWTDGSTLPTSGLQAAVYAPNAQAVAILSDGGLWAATFAQDGTVGSWQQLAALEGVSGGLLGVVSTDGADSLVVVAPSGVTFYAPLAPAASVTAWTTGATFPVAFSSGAGYQVGDDLVFVVQFAGVSTLVSLSVAGGGWSVSGTLPVVTSSVLGVIGSSLVTTDGSALHVTALTALGTAPWSLSVPLAVGGDNVNLLAFASGTGYVVFWIPTTAPVAGYRQPVYAVAWANVPLPATLTEGDTYHLVLSAVETLTAGVAVPVATGFSGTPGLIASDGWQPLGGAVPILVFYATSGVPLALIALGKTTILWFDAPTGTLTTTVELVDSTSQSRVLSYDDGVLIGAA